MKFSPNHSPKSIAKLHCELGWCITHKMPVRNPLGEIIAMLGVSVDVETNDSNRPELNKKIALLEKYIAGHFDQSIKMKDLEAVSRLSTAQIERYFKKIFHITPCWLTLSPLRSGKRRRRRRKAKHARSSSTFQATD